MTSGFLSARDWEEITLVFSRDGVHVEQYSVNTSKEQIEADLC